MLPQLFILLTRLIELLRISLNIIKFRGTTIAAAEAVKGSIGFVVAVACQDRICAIFSAIDIAADNLQICTPLIPGPSLTFVVSPPIYIILLVARYSSGVVKNQNCRGRSY